MIIKRKELSSQTHRIIELETGEMLYITSRDCEVTVSVHLQHTAVQSRAFKNCEAACSEAHYDDDVSRQFTIISKRRGESNGQH